MALAGASNLDAANRAFETAAGEVFGERPPGHYQKFTRVFNCAGRTNFDHVVVSGEPALREWLGPKQVGGLRAYRQNYVLRKWEKTISIDRPTVLGDSQGVVGARLADFARQEQFMFDKIVIDAFIANAAATAGYDGVTLLNNSHSNVGTGGTSDNLETAAISYSLFRTAQQKLREMMDEAGEPLNISPTFLLVGTAQEEAAMQITGSNKIVGISDAGELVAAGGSGMDSAAALLPNYIGGSVGVGVSARITGNEWGLFDTSKGETQAMALAVFENPKAVIKDGAGEDNVFYEDVIVYGLQAYATPAGQNWQCVVGSVSA